MSHQGMLNLICLPYAGGGASCFEPFRAHLPKGLNLKTVSLPGRGGRYEEPLLMTMEALTDDIFNQLKHQFHQPYALFGHSMGGMLAYLLCHKIRQADLPQPIHIFISGRAAPSVPHKEPLDYLLSYEAFKAKLKSYGGIAPEILANEEIFAFFEPMIRADFRAIQTWQYQVRPKLNVPASVFSSTEEDITQEELHAWQKEFSQALHFKMFKGNHFFIFEHTAVLMQLMFQRLQNYNLQQKTVNSYLEHN